VSAPAAASATGTAAASASNVSVTVVSGETGLPLAGARVIAAGGEHIADSAGNVTLPPGMSSFALVDLSATGFYDRQTTMGRLDAGGRFTMWPIESPTGMTQFFTAQVVYTWNDAAGPTLSMGRWAAGISSVEVIMLGPDDNPEYREMTPHMVDMLRRGLSVVNDALAGRIVYGEPTDGSDQPGNGRLRVRFNPDSPSCVDRTVAHVTYVEYPALRNVFVTFCGIETASRLSTVVHELGHSLGLRHSAGEYDVMYPYTSTRVETFSARERLALSLMLQRGPGNRFPDNDRSAGAANYGPFDILCR
jgi:hypothetical protein